MSKNKISFAEAIAWMTANPGKEVRGPGGDLFRYHFGCYQFYPGGETLWDNLPSFELTDIDGQWTIPEEKEELPEVEVEAYAHEDGSVNLYVTGSSDERWAIANSDMQKIKMKFNQGEE